jgi:hypothetical protein
MELEPFPINNLDYGCFWIKSSLRNRFQSGKWYFMDENGYSLVSTHFLFPFYWERYQKPCFIPALNRLLTLILLIADYQLSKGGGSGVKDYLMSERKPQLYLF